MENDVKEFLSELLKQLKSIEYNRTSKNKSR